MRIATPDSELWEHLQSGMTLSGQSYARLPVVAPFTGGVIAEIPGANGADVELAVALARAAQPEWAARSCAERARIFLRFHDLLLDRQDEVLDLIHGRPARRAATPSKRFWIRRWWRGITHGTRRRCSGRGGAGARIPVCTKTWEIRHPIGVVGFIVPWNYPLNLAVTDAIAALMAGNAGVLRPDPQSSLTALWAVALLREAGLPRDVLGVVTGEGVALGEALAARADYVMFTGSSRTGRTVGRQAAERLIGCSLELGGKNPQIVLADANVEAAIEGAIRGCFVGAGQVCISIERIYVHESIFERFLEGFGKRAQGLKLGAGFDYSVEMGSLTSTRQLARVEEHVADALAKGATLVAGGRPRPDLGPWFYEPTILTGVRPGMLLFAEETFGPVVSVYSFGDEEEAVRLANASSYGLSASIWTRSSGAACAWRGVSRRAA